MVLVGLSGGADSVALLAILVRLGYRCEAMHCNFHLRGGESDRDEAFAASFAAQLGVPFRRKAFDTRQYAADNHLSIEMAARELRYGWFEQRYSELPAQGIAVAHHRDDSVETMLMNMVRGTGIRGMCGIRPQNGHVVRPLLCVGRDEIVAWLDSQQLSYVTDSTNLQDIYTRNFIRLRVLSLLEELNPSVRTALARTSEHLSAVETIYLHSIQEARREVMAKPGRLCIPGLMRQQEPAALLYELLVPFGVNRSMAHDIFLSLPKESGKEFFTPTHRLIKDRDEILITTRKTNDRNCYPIDLPLKSCLEPIRMDFSIQSIDNTFRMDADKNIAYFDYGMIVFPMYIRRWQEGDWFVPFGMKGRKKLSDYFSNRKYSLLDKEETWLLCSGDDVIWLIGERMDDRFRVKKNTKDVLVVKIVAENQIDI